MVKRAWARMFALVNGLLIMVNAQMAFGVENVANSVNHGVILQYHHVADDTPAATSVSPDTFKKHMELLRRERFTVWPLPKLVEALQQGRKIPDKTVVITFDDAYSSIYRNALPVLRGYNFPFTLFVSTDFVDRRQKGYMNWDQLRELTKYDATIANHTKSHLHLLRKPEQVTQIQWLSSLREELDGAEARIKRETGQHWRYFAFPYGEADEGIIQAVKAWGYLGFGQQSGAVDKRLLASGMAPRFPFNKQYSDINDFLIKASSLPMPITSEKFAAVVFDKAVIPALDLTFSYDMGKPNCFASGQGAIKVELLRKNIYRVEANQFIPIGRSRYNCTIMAAGKPNRFHWYSRMWIRKEKNRWYEEP